MKKFSKIANVKVGEKSLVGKKLNEDELFRSKIISLMDNYLHIQTYGPIDRYLRAGTFKITGKEMFAESLINLMSNKSLKEQNKLLESLKSSVKDWEYIDEKIEQVNIKISEVDDKNKMINHRSKLVSLYETYKDDDELLLKMVENSSNKIKIGEKAHLRGITAEYMASEGEYPKEIFTKISESFYKRSKELGFNK